MGESSALVVPLLPKPFLSALLIHGLGVQSVTFSVYVWQTHFQSKRKPVSSQTPLSIRHQYLE